MIFDNWSNKMRCLHRYTGFFMAGIMTIYAFTGVALLYRNSHLLKNSIPINIKLPSGMNGAELAKNVSEKESLHLRHFKITENKNGKIHFSKNRYNSPGTYTVANGKLDYTRKEYPVLVDKLIRLHKSKIEKRYSPLNVAFGLTLFLFVFSSLFMFNPQNPIFKKGMLFLIAGFILSIGLLIFI